MKRVIRATQYWDFYGEDPLVSENVFRWRIPERTALPKFEAAKELLPEPFWDDHRQALDAYWFCWQTAFKNLRQPTRENRFVANYIDTAFNECVFMWDSVFILMFGRYGNRAFNFQRTLDNLYAAQHADGFITRELQQWDGQDRFHRYDPASTGPNVLAWSEWEYYLNNGDVQRLRDVFPPLVAYHGWMRRWRTWQDGTYWTCGLGCGMDNQHRIPPNAEVHVEHGHMAWIDATCQAAISARLIGEIARVIGRTGEIADVLDEAQRMEDVVNTRLWDETRGTYADRFANGEFSPTVGVGSFWPLLAGIVPPARVDALVKWLERPDGLNRRHRVPSLSANDPRYTSAGGYWRGAVWPPTNYMILRGLTRAGRHDLAHQIGLNHHQNVVEVFNATGTVWENYMPDSAEPGKPAKRDFVGWSGLGPITVLFEYVFGIRPDVPSQTIVWDVRLLEAHGVAKYPFGPDGLLTLRCAKRSRADEKPRIDAQSNVRVSLKVRWAGGEETISL